ncbi:MAG: arylesterase [Sphingomonadales bacterium]
MPRRVVKLCAAVLVACFSYAAQAKPDDGHQVLALGDSLTAGYGLEPGRSFPAKLEAALRAKGLKVTVHNAGVSGDTASAGLSRLDWALAGVPGKPDLVILELGANDMLRGVDPAVTTRALTAIMDRFKRDGVPVLIAGMKAAPNMGAAYVKQFDAIFPALAKKYDAPLYPFFLDGVAGKKALNLPDGLHPTAEGIDVIVTGIAPMVHSLLEKRPAGR